MKPTPANESQDSAAPAAPHGLLAKLVFALRGDKHMIGAYDTAEPAAAPTPEV